MPAPLERLYSFGEKDALSTIWGPWNVAEQESVSAVQIIFTSDLIPADRVVQLSHIAVTVRPGSAVDALSWHLSVRDVQAASRTINNIRLVDPKGAAAIDAPELSWTYHCDILLVGGVHFLSLEVNFSVAHAANMLMWGLQGITYPRGNAALY